MNGGTGTDKAEPFLNRVRSRAFNDDLHNYTGLSQSEFREKVRQERRLEFACEGQRYFDLVRWGVFVDVMKAHGQTEATLSGEEIKTTISSNVADKHNLYPVPQYEIDLNTDLHQNTGY